MDNAESLQVDKAKRRYNVYLANNITNRAAALENARRQSLAAANDLVRAYGMLDIKLNHSLIDNIMILGLRHAGGTAGRRKPAGALGDALRGRKSWVMAYCGMAAALCVALMLLGAVIPVLMFLAPAVASLILATVCIECGRSMAFTAYGAVSLLSVLFVPDKEVALTFVFLLGYYPLVKPYFDRIRPAVLRWAAQARALQRRDPCHVRPDPAAGSRRKHRAGIQNHGSCGLAVHAGNGQRGLSAL